MSKLNRINWDKQVLFKKKEDIAPTRSTNFNQLSSDISSIILVRDLFNSIPGGGGFL
jgi:hypothetical protein